MAKFNKRPYFILYMQRLINILEMFFTVSVICKFAFFTVSINKNKQVKYFRLNSHLFVDELVY